MSYAKHVPAFACDQVLADITHPIVNVFGVASLASYVGLHLFQLLY